MIYQIKGVLQMRSQEALIIDYLSTGRPLTAALAVDKWGIYRLAARIYNLRKVVNIQTETHHKGNRKWAVYRLQR